MKAWRSAFWDCVLLAGTMAIAYGMYLAWHPLGWIVLGLELAAGGLLAGYGAQRKDTE